MKKIIITSFLICLFSQTALAKACYSKREAEAEQGIRIHSELMVIGLNCINMRFSDGTNLYKKYNAFTRRNIDLFSEYEATLLDFYARQGNASPERSLDTLRTKLANDISNSATKMKPNHFCNQFANRIFKADVMDKASLRQWASTFYPDHPVSRPFCEQ